MDGPKYDRPHFWLPAEGQRLVYVSPARGGGGRPERNRDEHGEKLSEELSEALARARVEIASLDPNSIFGVPGFYLEILTHKEYFKPDAFELPTKGIFIASVTQDGEHLRVVVFVPQSALTYFQDAVEAYRTKNTRDGNIAFADRVERFDDFKLANIRSLWTDSPESFPTPNELSWWVVSIVGERQEHFLAAASEFGISVQKADLTFADISLHLVEATPERLAALVQHTDAVIELRGMPRRPSIVTHLETKGQHDLVAEVIGRVKQAAENAPALCLLDSGVNSGHPLLLGSVVLEAAWNRAWGPQDDDNHGTKMASVALFGNLFPLLATGEAIKVVNVLESVKVFTRHDQGLPYLRGVVTRDAVAIAESTRPRQARVFYSAVADAEEGNSGEPTEWSAEIDLLAAASDRRLFVLAAGNIDNTGRCAKADYPHRNLVYSIFEPGQAWNALTVGGYTEHTERPADPLDDYLPLAPAGAISPVSRTSTLWARGSGAAAPIKPDIVLEAGNFAAPLNEPDAVAIDDYLLLAANADFRARPMTPFGFTSAAAAQAAGLCGRLLADRPNLWPETVRGLIVHSASWTDFMRAELDAIPYKRDRAMFLRRYGYGVPNLAKALRSANNDATMIIQGTIKPFRKAKGLIKTNEMVSYHLPWPADFLEGLGNASLEMRITLSYFVEPNPGKRGWKGRYSYASHGLRFLVRRPLETDAQFDLRVNALDREGDYVDPRLEDEWVLGSDARNRGSIHSDLWIGTATQLANAGRIAVLPISGWWRYLKKLERWDSEAKYSLIVSLHAPGQQIDIYSAVEALVAVRVEAAGQP